MDSSANHLDFEKEADRIATGAASAFRAAFLAALKSGQSDLVAEDGKLVSVSPDGKRKTVKRIPKRIRIAPGAKFTIGSKTKSTD